MLLNTWQLVNTWEIPAVVSDEQPSGGYWEQYAEDYEEERRRKETERKARKRARRKAQKIKDQIERQIALEFRREEEELARKAELARFNRLVARNKSAIIELGNDRLVMVMEEALKLQTFSKMERLERELTQMYEEEEFLMLAAQILVNQ